MNQIERILKCRFYQFAKQHKNPAINFFYNERLRRILALICEMTQNMKSCVVLDIGCSSGYFSRVLSLKFRTVGFDIRKTCKRRGQKGFKKLNFVVADMENMPFRNDTVDVVVCASVLEHCKNLQDLLGKIKDVLKKGGFLIAGYPLETKFFKSVWKRVSPCSFICIDQSRTFWVNPYTHQQECYWENPSTHKQDYAEIRKTITKLFKVDRMQKLPLNNLPDSLTYYECVVASA